MMRRRVDSAGAIKWLRRAENMARSIKKSYEVRRAILDGYVVEGRRAGAIRTATVLDLPGRFVPFGNLDIATNIPGVAEQPWPVEVQSPTRAVMLDAAPGDDLTFSFTRPEPPPLQVGLIGEPPTDQLRSIGITVPSVSPEGVLQTRLVYEQSDPLPTVNVGDLTINYSGVSDLWVYISRWGAGSARNIELLINEQVLIGLFGCPIIQKTAVPWENTTEGERRAWASISNYTVVLALQLSENTRPYGTTASIGLLVVRPVDGEWQIVYSTKIAHSALGDPLFLPHTRIDYDTGSPLSPTQLSGFDMTLTGVATDGTVAWLSSVMRHEIDATGTVAGVLRRGKMVATGVFKAQLNLETFTLTHDVVDVTADVGLFAGATDLGGNLETTNGVVLSTAVTSWLSPDWPIHCTVTYDGRTLTEMLGYALGTRGNTLSSGGPSVDYGWRGTHIYRDPVTRVTARTLTRDVDGNPTEATTSITTNDFGFNAMTEPGSDITVYSYPPTYTGPLIVGIEDGQGVPIQATSIGLGGFEVPLYRGGTINRVVARLEMSGAGSTEVPIPSGATTPYSTCYRLRTSAAVTRGTVVYRLSGVTVLEVREGDITVAVCETIPDRYPLGVFYTGNALASAAYGAMGVVDG